MCYRYVLQISSLFFFFFFNDTATTEIYTLSLHDALPISSMNRMSPAPSEVSMPTRSPGRSSTGPDVVRMLTPRDRKSTRLNSSHGYISYAVFCLKKKKHKKNIKTIDNIPQSNEQQTNNAI